MEILLLIGLSYITTYQNGTLAILPKAIIKELIKYQLFDKTVKVPIVIENGYKFVDMSIRSLITHSLECNFCWNFWLGLIYFIPFYGISSIGLSIVYSIVFNKLSILLKLDEL